MERTPGIDPKRLVAIFYVFAAIVVGLFLEKVLGIVFSYVRWNDRQLLGDFTVQDFAGYACYALGGVAALVTWKQPRVQAVSLEVAAELNKVTWPSLRETRAATVAVVIATFVAAIILGVFDYAWASLSDLVWRWLTGGKGA
jgi:preprotein translocase subunit SecE